MVANVKVAYDGRGVVGRWDSHLPPWDACWYSCTTAGNNMMELESNIESFTLQQIIYVDSSPLPQW